MAAYNILLVSTQRVKNGGRGASGRRGDRPTTCTVLEASQERVRYASAPGCPGHGRASLALTDLHTHHRQRRRRWHAQVETALHIRRTTATSNGGPTGDTYLSPSASPDRRWRAPSGTAARPGAPRRLPCCSAEPLQSSFCGIMGGLSTLRLNGLRASTAVCGLRLFIIYPHLCKKPGKKTPRGSLFAVPR